MSFTDEDNDIKGNQVFIQNHGRMVPCAELHNSKRNCWEFPGGPVVSTP